MKKDKGLKSTNCQLQNSHRAVGVKYSIGNVANNTVIAVLVTDGY